nr:hypothetical protein [Xenorhabdus sp. psl]
MGAHVLVINVIFANPAVTLGNLNNEMGSALGKALLILRVKVPP